MWGICLGALVSLACFVCVGTHGSGILICVPMKLSQVASTPALLQWRRLQHSVQHCTGDIGVPRWLFTGGCSFVAEILGAEFWCICSPSMGFESGGVTVVL